jgi:ATP-dependent RNA helicase SUPV3L1/SUV3
MKRTIIYHHGPTNSGKTYSAMLEMMNPGIKAIYCAPLRLLAWEI